MQVYTIIIEYSCQFSSFVSVVEPIWIKNNFRIFKRQTKAAHVKFTGGEMERNTKFQAKSLLMKLL